MRKKFGSRRSPLWIHDEYRLDEIKQTRRNRRIRNVFQLFPPVHSCDELHAAGRASIHNCQLFRSFEFLFIRMVFTRVFDGTDETDNLRYTPRLSLLVDKPIFVAEKTERR